MAVGARVGNRIVAKEMAVEGKRVKGVRCWRGNDRASKCGALRKVLSLWGLHGAGLSRDKILTRG